MSRNQRTLYAAQLAVGGLSVFAVAGLAATGVNSTNPIISLVLIGLVGIGAVVVLNWLEGRKFRTPAQPEPEWAEQISNLTRSRREIVQAFEIERRRIERDLHDGAQQHVVAASIQVGEAALLVDQALAALTTEDCARVHHTLTEVAALLAKAQDTSDAALTTLRRTVAGIHPKVLSDMGLEAAVRDLAGRSGLTVAVHVPHPLPAMPEGVVAAAYFLVSEALTNVGKYAPDASVSVLLAADQDLTVSVVDDGPGGAVPQAGHGLMGMRERLAAFGGTLDVTSPAGGPTTLAARIPLLLEQGESSVVMEQPAATSTPKELEK